MDMTGNAGSSQAQVASIRFTGEQVYSDALTAIANGLGQVGHQDGAKIRRMLLARSLLLSQGMAPKPYAAARQAAATLGIEAPIEIYQAAGAENAAIHLCSTPVLLEIQGRLLSLLDDPALTAVMGHELGHYLAHGADSPHAAAAHAAHRLLVSEAAPDEWIAAARRLSMAMELTADRYGLMACRDLDAALRLEMVVVTGLPASELSWDTKAYLAQCQTLIESLLNDGETSLGHSHPEHSLRAWAIWLFSESDRYRELTGLGPGSRRIADVDAQLMRVLGHSKVALGSAAVFEEPQVEVQECALAACVLVATADGELHDNEVQAIEKVFAHLLPQWRELLDPAEALARFQELAPVLHASGPRAQRGLFILLTHVLAADGACEPEELDQILAIGAALGCLGLFRSLLPPVIALSGLAVDAAEERPVRSIPMPAESAQAHAALKIFFERAAGRGGDRVSARRLLRLIGAPRNSPEIRLALHDAAGRAGLTITPELGDALDALHQLVLKEGAKPAPLAPLPVDEPGSPPARLRKAITRLRDKLISGDGRSPSIRLRTPRNGRAFDLHQLEDVSTGLAERALELVSAQGTVVVLDGSEADAHEGARRARTALIALDRERQSRSEETGADELYLGYPFLTGTVNSYLLRGPLILYPAAIQRERGRVALRATANETPIANQALLRLLLRQKQIPFPDSLVEECDAAAETGPSALLALLERLGIRIVATLGQLLQFRDRSEELDSWRDDRLEIEDCAVLGLFPQSSSDLLHDYDDLLTQLQNGRSPAELFSCASEVLPAELKALAQTTAPITTVAAAVAAMPAIAADPVQRKVLEQARTAPALVVDGPPGTGKSQVIVNLVADALLRGEKVAVVCEKRAALDVVVNRLEALGLRHLLALVHDVHEDRKALYQQLAARVEESVARPWPAESLAMLQAGQTEIERELNACSQNLARSSAGISLGRAYTWRAGLEAEEISTPNAAASELTTLGVDQITSFANALQTLAPFADLWRCDSLWRAPPMQAPRPSLANLDAAQSAAILASLREVHQARLTLEIAAVQAGTRLDQDALDRLAAARTGLNAVIASRAARDNEQTQRLFSALLSAAVSDSAALPQVAVSLQAVDAFEQAFAAADLSPDRDTRLKLMRAEIPLLSVRDALRHSASAVARTTLSTWFRPGQSTAACSDGIDRASSLWRQHAVDARHFGQRVVWEDTSELQTAIALIASRASSLLRFFSPAWWKAKKQLSIHLARHWPEQASAVPNAALLGLIEQRRRAGLAWVAADALYADLSISPSVTSVDEVDIALREIGSARDHARLIEQARNPLDSLASWPPPSTTLAWQGFSQRIDACLAALPALAAAEQQFARLRPLLGDVELSLTCAAIEPVARTARLIAAIIAVQPVLMAADAWLAPPITPAALPIWDASLDAKIELLQALGSLQSTLPPIQLLLPWLGCLTPSEHWARLIGSWAANANRLADADRLLAMATKQHPGATALLPALADSSQHQPGQWQEAVIKKWLSGVIASLDSEAPAGLSEPLTQDTEDALADRYRQHCARATAQMPAFVLAGQDDNAWLRMTTAAKGARRNEVQAIKEGMLKEARKQRSLLPLRSFVRRYAGQGLLDALPVWLLSPETMTQLFPREARFDVVILDEASQCTVENGLPVLMRARRVVIAGDERQMPPSNFFKAASDDEDTADEAAVARDVLDAESLLVLARSRVAHTGLAWHYRCQQEELIAFSNHAIYGGELKTIPSVASRTAAAAVHWHTIADAQYEDGVNLTEAAAVVRLIGTIIDRPKPPTVGVVTFNLSQRRAVLDALDRARADDPVFAAAFVREATRERIDERPFVKNLENVQGDERDVIIFSLGHAPRERIRRDGRKERYVPARFGPVGLRGGERRLNVAASRAKQEIHVVASFDPALLSVAGSRNEGPRLFKGFLDFARAMSSGQRSEAGRVLDLMRGKPLRSRTDAAGVDLPLFVPMKTQLLLALEREGLRCELDVGASSFRVPLAIVDRNDPGRYQLGLLFADGEEADDPVETHLHVPGVLGQRGWQLMRINARDWARQPEQVLKRIRAVLSTADKR